MNVLIITQYFYPENFRINDICLGLKERGYNITVLTGKPNYPVGKYFDGYSWFAKNFEIWEGIKIYRSNLFYGFMTYGLRVLLFQEVLKTS